MYARQRWRVGKGCNPFAFGLSEFESHGIHRFLTVKVKRFMSARYGGTNPHEVCAEATSKSIGFRYERIETLTGHM